jgi:hypothetical protein
MSKEFEDQLRLAFPSGTDSAVVRSVGAGVALADDARRNIEWLGNDIGDDLRGSLRRAAAMWRFRQDCLNGNLPFTADEVPNTTGTSHLLRITAGRFEAHIVRTESEGAFPKDAPIRQNKSLHNEPDMFIDGKIIPLHELPLDLLYAFLTFNADPKGMLTHVCWCMPEAQLKQMLAVINILPRSNIIPMPEPHTPPPPDPTEKLKFRKEVAERLMDETRTPKDKKTT